LTGGCATRYTGYPHGKARRVVARTGRNSQGVCGAADSSNNFEGTDNKPCTSPPAAVWPETSRAYRHHAFNLLEPRERFTEIERLTADASTP
jgi:hypothetical protein